MILVGKIDYLLDSRLNNRLCTFVTGEESYIERRACERFAAGVKYCVELRVYDELILRLTEAFVSVPRELIVGATVREAVISGREYSFFGVDDACADLRAGILRSLSGEERNAHKVFIPRDIILSFH